MTARAFCQASLYGPQLEVVEVLEYVAKTSEETRHYVRLRAGDHVRSVAFDHAVAMCAS